MTGSKTSGIPKFRTKVLYVPQRPALLPGTPRQFLQKIHEFASRQASNSDGSKSKSKSNAAKEESESSAARIAKLWGIEDELWDREWASLSGGEAQRMSLAIALGVKGAEVLLLDGTWTSH